MIADPTKGPAVVLLLTRGTDILALTRRERVHDLHLPGGKVEPEDHDEAHAATRELAEETGIYLHHEQLRPLCSFVAHTGRPCQAFTTEPDHGWPETFRATEAGWPGWVPHAALVQPWCTFRREAYRVLAARWPIHWGAG